MYIWLVAEDILRLFYHLLPQYRAPACKPDNFLEKSTEFNKGETV